MKHSHASLFVFAGLLCASTFAQQPQGMVNVDLGTVADSLAKNIKVDAATIPASMQLPVGIAAAACGIPAAKLAPTGDMASCQAVGTSAALEQHVARQLKAPPKQ